MNLTEATEIVEEIQYAISETVVTDEESLRPRTPPTPAVDTLRKISPSLLRRY